MKTWLKSSFCFDKIYDFPANFRQFSPVCTSFSSGLPEKLILFSIFFQIVKCGYFPFYSFFFFPLVNDIASAKSNCFLISGTPTGLIPAAVIIFFAFVLGVRGYADVLFLRTFLLNEWHFIFSRLSCFSFAIY